MHFFSSTRWPILRTLTLVGSFFLGKSELVLAQQIPWSERMATSIMAVHRDSISVKEGKPATWDYEQGLLLTALERVWHRTGDAKYYRYLERNLDSFVGNEGRIRTYAMDEYNLDNLTTGRALLTAYEETGKEKFRLAAQTLRQQLKAQPRLKEGGFWHKQRYPNQMWLDGLYMAGPFYAEYARRFGEAAAFDDIANQFVWMESHARDPKSGLLYHAYDESRAQRWADPKTGQSPNFWSRAMGWYAMALLDVLDYFPQTHPRRGDLAAIFKRLMPALLKVQDPKTGLWMQVTDKLGAKGNYPEASASCMFVYALAKGVRLGLLDESYLVAAKKGYAGILKTFVETAPDGNLALNGTVSVGGLGGTPYRDGSYAYYLSEPIRKNDLKGVGPFILASVEMEMAAEPKVGRGKTVTLDYFFNREVRKTKDGQTERFHYTWEDRKDSGFWLWGRQFEALGAKLDSLPVAPTAANLKGTDVYILVDPDSPKESPHPNYIEAPHIEALADWVKAGGVLLLMGNDTANVETAHFNQLAAKFGMSFLPQSLHMVQGTQWEQGAVLIPAAHPIFGSIKKVYIKELSPLRVQAPATSALSEGSSVIIASAKYGKGTVLAVGDPWLYNEYLNGKRIPTEYENFGAGKALAGWLLGQVSR